jgi:hypothetical protein
MPAFPSSQSQNARVVTAGAWLPFLAARLSRVGARTRLPGPVRGPASTDRLMRLSGRTAAALAMTVTPPPSRRHGGGPERARVLGARGWLGG